MIHAGSRATNLVDQKMMHDGISQAKAPTVVYTYDWAKLVSRIMEPAGEKQLAMGSGATLISAATSANVSNSAGAFR
jgi:hypothetical protein